jgi:REP element-mobilizing transposase RayT
VGGFVSLLWLAPDHVHLYVISDGEKSVETIVQEIKRSSNDAIMGEFADIKDRFDAGNELWDTAYFSETAG